jgi:hypothetical protein
VPAIDRLKGRIRRQLSATVVRWMTPELTQAVLAQTPGLAQALLTQPRIYGPPERLRVAATAVVNDALFNLSSGTITVGEWAMLGHGVMVLTGIHDVAKLGEQRQTTAPAEGRDVVIEEGAWLASNVTVLGPCRIGAHAVVAAGSLVRHDVAPFAIVAGLPAQVVGQVPKPEPGPNSTGPRAAQG